MNSLKKLAIEVNMKQLHYYLIGVQTRNNRQRIVRGVIAHNATEVKDIFKRCKRIFKYDKLLQYKQMTNSSSDLLERYNKQMDILRGLEK